MPGPPQDTDHVAWFSAPRAAPGSRIEVANATLGWRDGAPFVHCHAVWIEADGSRRGGHILPDETIVADGAKVQAWGIEARIAAEPDAETNFTLFHPVPEGEAGSFVTARVRPNQDIGAALSALCGRHGFGRAAVLGSVGSLIGAGLRGWQERGGLRDRGADPGGGRHPGERLDRDGRRGHGRSGA